VKLGGPLKEKWLYITVTLGPLESKVFTHYNCCWGPFERQVAYTSQLLLGSFESKVLYTLQLLLGPLWMRSDPTFTVHMVLWASLKW